MPVRPSIVRITREPRRAALRRCAAGLLLSCSLPMFLGSSSAVGQVQGPDPGAWLYLQKQFYGDRDIGLVDEKFMSLQAPANTPDPASTPLTVRFGAAAVGRIKQLRIIIDNNPSPLAATFDFAPGARINEVGLHVRVDRFTTVLAIAETTHGRLEMRSQWVNASGGCSAPPSAAAGGKIGEIRFWSTPDGKTLRVGVRHPNYSGFQIDPLSGDPIPPHYVAQFRLSADGRPWVEAKTGISLSENPSLRIGSDALLPAPIEADIVDSKDAHFSANWQGPGTARAAGH